MIRKSIRFSPSGARIIFLNSHVLSFMFSTLRPRIMPFLRTRVTRLARKWILGNRGRRSSCLGALQFVSGLNDEHAKPNATQYIPVIR